MASMTDKLEQILLLLDEVKQEITDKTKDAPNPEHRWGRDENAALVLLQKKLHDDFSRLACRFDGQDLSIETGRLGKWR